MARIRTVKPEFWASEDVAAVSRDARLLFIGLLNFADDSGNGPAGSKGLKIKVFPGDADVTLEKIENWLNELDAELIGLYEAEDKQYYHVMKWEHQRIDKPQPPKYPTFVERSRNIPASLPPDSIVKDSKDRIGKDRIVRDSKVTPIPRTFVELAQSFLVEQREAFPKESAWKDFEGRVTDGGKNLHLFLTQNDWTEEEIRNLLDWILLDDFWSKQIRTLGGIRQRKSGEAMKFENARASMLAGEPRKLNLYE